MKLKSLIHTLSVCFTAVIAFLKFLLRVSLYLFLFFLLLFFVLVGIAFYHPYHEENYYQVPEKSAIPFKDKNFRFYKANNVEIRPMFLPTNKKNKGYYNWEKASGPYMFRIIFDNNGLIVKNILITDIDIASLSSNKTIFSGSDLNIFISFPSHDEKDHPNYPNSKCIHISDFKLDDLIYLDFKSGESVGVTIKAILTTVERNEQHEIKAIFTPKLIEGYFQYPMP